MKNVYMILCATALVVGLGMSPAYAGQPEDSERTCTDGKDNDRNGLIDCEEATCAPFCGGGCTENDTQICDTGEQGECAVGTETCSGGAWGSCVRDNDPVTEICDDGLDNDCDGDTDDADSDCAPVCTPNEDPEVSCSDGVDN
ncbi:MAG: hypothetical protein GQ541_03050, partial [Desulfovibrionaceae bacterium]|nr:hypothetical protein [Desulfovibrionaceae bacterium]